MHPREGADDFQMTEFLGADVHQQILAIRIFAIEALDRVLHGGGKFAVGAAELLEQHVAEARIRLRRRGPCTSISSRDDTWKLPRGQRMRANGQR